jgi:ketosteroid isomerase-like protein
MHFVHERGDPVRTPTEPEVLEAADAIIAAFAATDTDAYFAGFADDASFVFHPEPARLNSRAEYQELWNSWLRSGWRVLSCTSEARLVQCFAGGAVFSHTVATTVDAATGSDSYRERETIVFRTSTEGLIAIHEHLSPGPVV